MSEGPPTGQRDASIDALRACALCGILVVNLPFFAIPGGFAGSAWQRTGPSLPDLVTAAVIQGLFESKFILIFSALFGYGAWRQLVRYGTARYARRLVALAVFGILDFVLLFESDVLLPYAIMGAMLIALRERPVFVLVAAAIAFWTCAVVGIVLFGASLVLTSSTTGSFGDQAGILSTGTFGAIVSVRLSNWVSFQSYCLWSNYPLAFAAMLMGFSAGRFAEAEGIDRLNTRIRAIVSFVLAPALIGNVVYGVLAIVPDHAGGAKLYLLQTVLRPLFAPLLSLVLVCYGLSVLRQPCRAWMVRLLAPAGRMSMTTYLGFSAAMGLIFFGYGFGLHGQLTLTGTLGVSIAMFAAFIAAAQVWERSVGQGPAELIMARLMNATGGKSVLRHG